jgi:hypothetical protein
MKITSYQTEDERAVLTGMIVSDRVLARIFPRLEGERKPFSSKWSNIVAGWCLNYFASYKKAPRKHILSLFRDWAEKAQDEGTVGSVEKYLSTLSEDYERAAKELNVDYLIDRAARHFNSVRLEKLAKSVEADLLRKDSDAALEKINSFRKIRLATTDMVNFFQDKELLMDLFFAEEEDVMIHYPKDLGEFFGPHLCRDGFIAFLAPEKRGKSFWLLDLAWRAAVKDKRRTLFYSVGDMSKKQVARRLYARSTRRPERKGSVRIPVRVGLIKGRTQVKTREETNLEPISMGEVIRAHRQIQMSSARSESLLKYHCTGNGETSVADIEADIAAWILKGWVPDVVVIDYADILAPEAGAAKQDFRHQVNITWQALRRLSQRYHILVVTATQSDTVSYGQELLRRSNFSEDKRKLSHVTGMVGLNQTEEEKRKGIYRLNWIVLREGPSSENRVVHVAGCLAIANPAIVSAW